jgi:hypothetical protein
MIDFLLTKETTYSEFRRFMETDQQTSYLEWVDIYNELKEKYKYCLIDNYYIIAAKKKDNTIIINAHKNCFIKEEVILKQYFQLKIRKHKLKYLNYGIE